MYKTKAGQKQLLNRFYDNFVLPIKNRFDAGIHYLNLCLEEYYKSSMNIGNKQRFDSLQVQKYKNELISLEILDLARFLNLQKKLAQSKDYKLKLAKFAKSKIETFANLRNLTEKHPKYLTRRIKYLFDSKQFEHVDFARSVIHSTDKLDSGQDPAGARQCIETIVSEKHFFKAKLYQMNVLFVELMKLTHETTTSKLRTEFHSVLKERYFNFIREYTLEVNHFHDGGREDPANEHIETADKLRNTEYMKNYFKINKLKVENTTLFQQAKWNPFFFQETYKKIDNEDFPITSIGGPGISRMNMSNIKDTVKLGLLYRSKILVKKKAHLVVLVHGYQATHKDMRIMQNFLAKIIPHTIFLASKNNENMKDNTLDQMGANLAHEVTEFCANQKNISKISFIGHSLGGVIIRAALSRMKHLRPKLFTFVSLSSPHLGCLQNKSTLVKIGMNILELGKDKVISTLQMTDGKNFRDSFLFKLAQQDKLFWFNNLILVSSPQDKWVPYSSARIQPEKPHIVANLNDKDTNIYEMAEMIWDNVDNDMIVRIDVDLRSPERYDFILLFILFSFPSCIHDFWHVNIDF